MTASLGRASATALAIALAACGSPQSPAPAPTPAPVARPSVDAPRATSAPPSAPPPPPAPGPEVLVEGAIAPAGIAIAGDWIYATDPPTASIVKLPIAGGATTALASKLGFPRRIVVRGDTVYFADRERVSSVGTGGGAVRDFAIDAADDSVAVDDANVYFFAKSKENVLGLHRMLYRMPIAKGGKRAAVCNPDGLPQAIVVEGGTVYFASAIGGAIGKCPTRGGPIVTLAPGKPVTTANATNVHIALFDGVVYWSDAYAHAVSSVSANGGTPAIVHRSASEAPRGLAVDARDIVWVTSEGTVNRVPRAGGAVELLASEQGQCVDVALTASHVVWTCYRDTGYGPRKTDRGGHVSRLARRVE